MTETMKKICEELVKDNGDLLVNDEYNRCIYCGKGIDATSGVPKIRHTDECIVCLAQQALDSETSSA